MRTIIGPLWCVVDKCDDGSPVTLFRHCAKLRAERWAKNHFASDYREWQLIQEPDAPVDGAKCWHCRKFLPRHKARMCKTCFEMIAELAVVNVICVE